jgi:hypothetical protein
MNRKNAIGFGLLYSNNEVNATTIIVYALFMDILTCVVGLALHS